LQLITLFSLSRYSQISVYRRKSLSAAMLLRDVLAMASCVA
jgi:hypothetical protein